MNHPPIHSMSIRNPCSPRMRPSFYYLPLASRHTVPGDPNATECGREGKGVEGEEKVLGGGSRGGRSFWRVTINQSISQSINVGKDGNPTGHGGRA